MKKALVITTVAIGEILIRGLPEGWESSRVDPGTVLEQIRDSSPAFEASLAGKDLLMISNISIDVIETILKAVDPFLANLWPLIACSTSGEVYPEDVPPRCDPVFIHDITPAAVRTALDSFSLSAPVLTSE